MNCVLAIYKIGEEFICFSGKIIQTISFSIIITVFNKQKYLPRSFSSLESQSYQNYEIIYIDDHSEDQSSEFILQKMRNDKRIKLIQHTYNQGISNSRIHGVLHSNGKYIMTLDPDDVFYKNTLNFSYNKVKEMKSDVLEIQVEFREGRNFIIRWYPCTKNYTDRESIFNDLQQFVFKKTPWNLYRKIVKNEIYKKAVHFLLPFVSDKKINYGEDLIQCGAIFLFSKNWMCNDFVGYVYYNFLPNSSMTGYYQNVKQNEIQTNFAKQLLRYFYKNRFALDNCTTDDFLISDYNRFLFNSINNLTRINSTKKCDINFQGFSFNYIEKDSYCFIE